MTYRPVEDEPADALELLDELESELRRVETWDELEDWLNSWPQAMSLDRAGQFSLERETALHPEHLHYGQRVTITLTVREGFCPPKQLRGSVTYPLDELGLRFNRWSSARDLEREMREHAERKLFNMFKTNFLELATERLTP